MTLASKLVFGIVNYLPFGLTCLNKVSLLSEKKHFTVGVVCLVS